MQYPIPEKTHTINGVEGRMLPIHAPQEVRENLVYRAQKWVSQGRKIEGYGTDGVMQVKIRFDDQCRNGHQTFTITADVYTKESRRIGDVQACGCLHDDIEKVFPELAPLIKWHLVSTDGPLHYIANTVYHASDRIVTRYSEGKKRNLDAARNSAVWPDATDEQLSVEPEELTAALLARLPILMAAFRKDMENAGFLWEPESK